MNSKVPEDETMTAKKFGKCERSESIHEEVRPKAKRIESIQEEENEVESPPEEEPKHVKQYGKLERVISIKQEEDQSESSVPVKNFEKLETYIDAKDDIEQTSLDRDYQTVKTRENLENIKQTSPERYYQTVKTGDNLESVGNVKEDGAKLERVIKDEIKQPEKLKIEELQFKEEYETSRNDEPFWLDEKPVKPDERNEIPHLEKKDAQRVETVLEDKCIIKDRPPSEQLSQKADDRRPEKLQRLESIQPDVKRVEESEKPNIGKPQKAQGISQLKKQQISTTMHSIFYNLGLSK